MTGVRRALALSAIVTFVALTIAVVWLFRDSFSMAALETWVASMGLWAPIGFVVIYAVATIVMVPGTPFDMLAGALFGPYFGALMSFCGCGTGAALSFLIARYVASDWVALRARGRLQGVMASIDAEGWKFVAFVRIVPFFPYTVLNYLLGLTRIPFSHYMMATLVFMAPSTVGYTWLGHASRGLLSASEADKVGYALAVLGVVIALLFVPRFVKRFRCADAVWAGATGAAEVAAVALTGRDGVLMNPPTAETRRS